MLGKKGLTEQELLKTDCWCFAMKRQVNLEGVIVGKSQADLLKVTDCLATVDGVSTKDCPKRFAIDCLIKHVREGRW